jgi:hypothetical protein
MTTFQPQTPNWLSPSWDDMYKEDPELIEAYGYPDYPDKMTGEGNWIDLFLDAGGQTPVGRLWIGPDAQTIGLEQVQNGNVTWLTKSALNLREFNKHGVGIFSAYDFVKNDYYCGEEKTGDLSDARVSIDAA